MNCSCRQNVKNPDRQCVYYLHIPLFVMDVVRMFQDHPKYKNGITQDDIVDILKQEKFANGDLSAQVESAIKSLESSGYLFYIGSGYRTLGPLAKLAIARTPKQRKTAWARIQEKI